MPCHQSHATRFLFVLSVCLSTLGCYAPPVQNMPYGNALSLFNIDDPAQSSIAKNPQSQLALARTTQTLGGNLLIYPKASDDVRQCTYQAIADLPNINHVSSMTINWDAIRQQAEADETPIDYKRALLDHAKAQHGDLLLLYDMQYDGGFRFFTLLIGDLISFGYTPTVLAHAQTNLQAILIDTHSEQVLAVFTGDANAWQVTNLRNAMQRIRQCNARAEDAGLTDILDQFIGAWLKHHQQTHPSDPLIPPGVPYSTQ